VYATWDQSPLVQPYGPEPLGPRGAALAAHPPAGVFVDCLHFDPPFLTALGELTGADRYLRAGVGQACGYVKLLQSASGLFEHFVLDGEPGTYGPGWGRGQGWALLGLLDVLAVGARVEVDQELDESLAYLRAATARLVLAMVGLQREDGHWYAVVDNPASGDEFSTAAFMASGFVRALSMGIVSQAEAAGSAESARQAVLRALTPEGVLEKVSAAVMASTLASHYAHVPTGFFVPWGQGPAALALVGAPHAG
jgi:unsaturated rhamnogalacturonyl hydrolase